MLSKLNLDGVVCSFQKKLRSFYINKADGGDGFWRYHMKFTGFITFGSQTEIIDDVVIA